MIILPTVPIETMNSYQDTCENLFGPLNEVEKKYAPDTLYCAGDRLLFKECPRIAVIGSRKVSADGAGLAAEISNTVVNHGGLVVSGLATRATREFCPSQSNDGFGFTWLDYC